MASRKHTVTSKARTANAANLRKARAAHPKGHLTAKQAAADRANLLRGVAAHTSAQIAADRANGKKAALSMRLHPSAKLLAAERAWALKGEAAWRAAWLRGELKWKAHRRGASHLRSLRASRRSPLGTRIVHPSLKHKLTMPKMLGEPRRFERRITPQGAPGTTTAWRNARAHHFKKRIHVRKARRTSIGNWRRSRKRIRPR